MKTLIEKLNEINERKHKENPNKLFSCVFLYINRKSNKWVFTPILEEATTNHFFNGICFTFCFETFEHLRVTNPNIMFVCINNGETL